MLYIDKYRNKQQIYLQKKTNRYPYRKNPTDIPTEKTTEIPTEKNNRYP